MAWVEAALFEVDRGAVSVEVQVETDGGSFKADRGRFLKFFTIALVSLFKPEIPGRQ